MKERRFTHVDKFQDGTSYIKFDSTGAAFAVKVNGDIVRLHVTGIEDAEHLVKTGHWKEVTPKLANIKFKVKDEEHSKAIQETLFAAGYKWMVGSDTVLYTTAPYLYASENGTLMHGTDEDRFVEYRTDYVEKVLKTVYEIVDKPIEVFEFQGKKYDADAVKAALKDLTEL